MDGIDNDGMEIEPSGVEDLKGKLPPDSSSATTSTSSSSNEDDDATVQPKTACSFLGDSLEKFWSHLGKGASNNSYLVRIGVYVILALLYNASFVASIYYQIHNGIELDWCDGVGFLIILNAVVYLGLFYFQVVKKFWGRQIYKSVLKPIEKGFDRAWSYRINDKFPYV